MVKNINVRPLLLYWLYYFTNVLNISGENFAGRVGTIVGWGRVAVEKSSSKVLLKASLRILSDEDCSKSQLAQHLKPTMMCAFSKGKDGCQVIGNFNRIFSDIVQNNNKHNYIMFSIIGCCIIFYGRQLSLLIIIFDLKLSYIIITTYFKK